MIGNAVILVKGGKGGNGSISFRHEKFVPCGGPDGGDGGKGGNVYLVGMDGVADLAALRYRRSFEGVRGVDGAGAKKYGKAGKDTLVEVPLGTRVWETDEAGARLPYGEVCAEGERLLAADGGKGGRGNVKFVSSTNKVPLLAEGGEDGGERELYLAYWPLVDVGLVSLPNAGKSQLLQAISRAFPLVAEYPFSTREPVIGVVSAGWAIYTAIESPSLCDGAHEGKGLGNEFLACMMRAKLLLLLVDGMAEDPAADVATLRRELRLYDETLGSKAYAVAVTKIDLPEVAERMLDLRHVLQESGLGLYFISSVTGEGLDALKTSLGELLKMLPPGVAPVEPPLPGKRLRDLAPEPLVAKDGDVFVVTSPRLERIVEVADLRVFQARLQFRREMDKLGVLEALTEAGVHSGDAVRIGNAELEWE